MSNRLTTRMSRCTLALALLATLAPTVQAQNEAPKKGSELVGIEQLKTEAFKALRGGDFDRTNSLLHDAAVRSGDPQLSRMSDWIGEFQSQREIFVADRRKQYEKAVQDMQLLLKNGKDSFAIDKAKDAYLLADNKDAFSKEKWVQDISNKTIEMAKQFEANDRWYPALRLYADLGAIQPANPEWKEKLKVATRRMRLLAVYTPEVFKKVQESEIAERDAVDRLLGPSTRPATKLYAEENDSFRINWDDMLRGIDANMLIESLDQARVAYWKDVAARKLLEGGLNGLQTLVTTSGLEQTFPNLGDSAKKQKFIGAIGEQLARLSTDHPISEGWLIRDVIAKIKDENKNSVQLPENVLVNEFADGAFAELDPFSSPIWPNDVADFNKGTQGEFGGVGVEIRLDDEGNLEVVSPLEDTPAYKIGIKAGDQITRIDGKNARGISISQAVKNITGLAGTFVTLTIRSHDGTQHDYPIRRETIQVASIKGWQRHPGGGWEYFVDPDQKIGYVRLTQFTKSTAEDLDKAIAQMSKEGMRGMILDLRYNPGGLLSAAADVCDKFLKEGVIVSTKAERETLPVQPPIDAHAQPDDVTVPLVVLVNQYSASASEIVSGALKDQKRAFIVGERTFGKGSVQMLFPLSGRTALLKLTTSHYYLPSGVCIHREENSTTWGVDPDVTVEMTPKQMADAIEARRDMDVLRSAEDMAVLTAIPSTQPSVKGDLIARDPQLSAALLMLRMELAGATLVASK